MSRLAFAIFKSAFADWFSAYSRAAPKRGQDGLALSRKLTTQRLMPLGLAIGFLRVTREPRWGLGTLPPPIYPPPHRGGYIGGWGYGG